MPCVMTKFSSKVHAWLKNLAKCLMVGLYGNEKCFSKNFIFKKSIISNANGCFLFWDNFLMNFFPISIVRKTLKGRKKNIFSAKTLSWFIKM